ncbi:MAG: response regulator [Chitinivibrionales bacterium]|nr:response regulator [Chitinivibrionales bacterium]
MSERPYHLLLVEDESELLRAMATVLRSSGHRITTATEGTEALERLEQAEAGGAPVDLLITDIQMPGMNGEELIAIVRQRYPDLLILVITGYGDKELITRLMRLGCNEYLDKPFTGAELEARIRPLLARCEQERQRRERQGFERQRLEKLAAIGQNVAGIVHDLSNQLGVIDGFRGMLQGELSDPKHLEYCRQMAMSSFRAAHMVGDVMSAAVDDDGVLAVTGTEVDIAQVIETVVKLSGIRRPVHVDLHDRCLVYGRKQRLEMVFWNLLRNADEAMVNREGAIRIESQCEGGWVTVSVSDKGPGIHESIRDSLFEPGKTYGKNMGHGLGLYASKRTVEGHGGTITFDTKQGEGTTFRVRLPRAGSGLVRLRKRVNNNHA